MVADLLIGLDDFSWPEAMVCFIDNFVFLFESFPHPSCLPAFWAERGTKCTHFKKYIFMHFCLMVGDKI